MSQANLLSHKILITSSGHNLCSYCKGIRDDEGYWATIEEFIAKHSEVELTHSVCDRCMQMPYPEAAKMWQAKQAQR